MKLDRLKIPTGKRLTSWLCTSAAAELNLAQNQLVVRAGLELGITLFQVQRANHSAMQPPLHGSFHTTGYKFVQCLNFWFSVQWEDPMENWYEVFPVF